MRINIIATTSLFLCVFIGCTQTQPAPSAPAVSVSHDYAKWEPEITTFEQTDRTNPPAKGGVLFIGSSTIRMWDTLEKDFPNHHVINRGFGGSEIMDSTFFAERIIFPYEPKMIFLRAGGNDIHAGKSPEEVFANFKAFADKIHAKLPKTQIVYISQCPTPARWPERDAYKTLNTLVQQYLSKKPYLKYLELYEMTITTDGQPRTEIFIADKQHFNAEGYKLLADRVRPLMPN